ncbi:MAG: HNH endonuclease [Deltaproteobacteria bacterium]|nr:HNH endonuclease [Deltaproteobacteria bacterium]
MLQSLKSTPDQALVSQLESLRGAENKTVAEMIRYLAELDARGIYRDMGHSSLFTFCTEYLRYPESSAYRRVQGARMLRRHPEVYEHILSGKIHLSSVVEIAKVEDRAKRAELLKASIGKGTAEVREMTASVLPPAMPKRETIRAKAIRVAMEPEAEMGGSGAAAAESNRSNLYESSGGASSHKMNYSFSMEVDDQFMRLYREAKEIVGHVRAKDVLQRTLEEFVARRKRMLRAVKRAGGGKGRFIPKSVRVEIVKRDGGQCTYVSPDGKRCTERHGLEIDHVMPYGLGGGNEKENLRLLCRAHNRLMAERVFGKQKMVRSAWVSS